MRQKLITLCPNSFEIAQKKGNFSQWVRNKLLEEREPIDKRVFSYTYKCPLCKTVETHSIRHARTCEKCVYVMDFVREVVEWVPSFVTVVLMSPWQRTMTTRWLEFGVVIATKNTLMYSMLQKDKQNSGRNQSNAIAKILELVSKDIVHAYWGKKNDFWGSMCNLSMSIILWRWNIRVSIWTSWCSLLSKSWDFG